MNINGEPMPGAWNWYQISYMSLEFEWRKAIFIFFFHPQNQTLTRTTRFTQTKHDVCKTEPDSQDLVNKRLQMKSDVAHVSQVFGLTLTRDVGNKNYVVSEPTLQSSRKYERLNKHVSCYRQLAISRQQWLSWTIWSTLYCRFNQLMCLRWLIYKVLKWYFSRVDIMSFAE